MLVKRLSAIIGKNIGGSLGWDGTPDAHWELGRKLGENFKIGRWDWDYENRHWADTASNTEFNYVFMPVRRVGNISTVLTFTGFKWSCISLALSG